MYSFISTGEILSTRPVYHRAGGCSVPELQQSSHCRIQSLLLSSWTRFSWVTYFISKYFPSLEWVQLPLFENTPGIQVSLKEESLMHNYKSHKVLPTHLQLFSQIVPVPYLWFKTKTAPNSFEKQISPRGLNRTAMVLLFQFHLLLLFPFAALCRKHGRQISQLSLRRLSITWQI